MIKIITEKFITHYRQMARYTVIGVLCFLVNYTIAILLENHIPSRISAIIGDIPSWISATVGYIVGALLNYVLSIKWVFTKRELKDEQLKEFSFFIAIEVSACLVMLLMKYILMGPLGIVYEIAIIPANFIAAIWNYCVKHILLFRKHGKKVKSEK